MALYSLGKLLLPSKILVPFEHLSNFDNYLNPYVLEEEVFSVSNILAVPFKCNLRLVCR